MKNKLVTSTLLTNSLLGLLVILSVNILLSLNTDITRPTSAQTYINKHCAKLKEHIQTNSTLTYRDLVNFTSPTKTTKTNDAYKQNPNATKTLRASSTSICAYMLRANPLTFIE